MDIREILKKVDHTLLGVTAGWSDIEQILIDAEKFGTASACIPPAFVKRAKDYVGDRVKICTVIGFPNGYNTTAVKVFETADAVANGADDIDMVINVGELKSGNTVYVENEIKAVRAACRKNSEGHYRNLPAYREREDSNVRYSHALRCRLYKDFDRLLDGRRNFR